MQPQHSRHFGHRSFRFCMLFLFLTVASVLALSRNWGGVPALGYILNPFTGLWQNGPSHSLSNEQVLNIKGLHHPVTVKWDESRIPHIFAQDAHDLYMAQGFLVAQNRLWQMDLNTRLAAGRVSELLGARGLKLDEFFVRLGMRTAAERAFDELMADPTTKDAVLAYAEGVNAHIDSLNPKNYPAEYKLTGTKPEPWEPIRTAYLLKIMSFQLAGYSDDVALSKLAQKLGYEAIQDLFPLEESLLDPVILEPVPRAQASEIPQPPRSRDFVTALKELPNHMNPLKSNGSNNWAVGPKKSATGHSIVSNDTHLGYGLPAVWFEQQLITPELNVYGATFPGAPGVIIGFNRQVSWAVTNASTDVLDWYEVEFKDPSAQQYLFEGKWKPVESHSEIIRVRGQGDREIKMIWTHHGPLVHQEKKLGLVAQWTVHRRSNELKTFLALNRAQDYDQCLQALRHYMAPAQNFICADQANIGLVHNGLFPKRWRGQGQMVLDGRLKQNDWAGWIEREQNPRTENPYAGYVRSANQNPVDEEYPYFLGGDYPEAYRGLRIRQVLAQDKKWDIEDLQALQGDVVNLHAESVLPDLLNVLDDDDLSEDQDKALQDLARWDFQDAPDRSAPTVFHAWWKSLEKSIWQDQLGERKATVYPKTSRTVKLIKSLIADPKSSDLRWVDNSQTERKENLRDVVATSFHDAWKELKKEHGPYGKAWHWGKVRPTQLQHMAKIPGMGSHPMPLGGSAFTVNANQGWHGATWRMIVELGSENRGFVNYPGGQTGNPFDPGFENFVETWARGELRPVLFMKTPEDEQGKIVGQMQLSPES